jgi:hypothetical protein
MVGGQLRLSEVQRPGSEQVTRQLADWLSECGGWLGPDLWYLFTRLPAGQELSVQRCEE